MSDPRKQLEDGTHPDIVWDDYHAGKNPIDVLCDHLDEIERLQAEVERKDALIASLLETAANPQGYEMKELKRVNGLMPRQKRTLDAVRFAVMLAGQSIVEAHGEDSAAYEAIQSVAKALEEAGDE